MLILTFAALRVCSIVYNNEQRHDTNILLDTLKNEFIVSITDTSGNILEVNDAFCDVSQYSAEELIGSNHRIYRLHVSINLRLQVYLDRILQPINA